MARTSAQKELQKSVQGDIRDLVLDATKQLAGETEPESDVAGDSSPKGEEEVSTEASADDDLQLKAKTAKRFEKLTADLKAAKEEVEALKEGKERTVPKKDKAAQQADQITDNADLNMLLAERRIARLTGRNWDPAQMNVLLQLREEAPGIDGQALVYLAERGHSELFDGVEGAHGELSPSHHVHEPRSETKRQETTESTEAKLDKQFVKAARAGSKVGMKRALRATIKDALYKETIPKGRRR